MNPEAAPTMTPEAQWESVERHADPAYYLCAGHDPEFCASCYKSLCEQDAALALLASRARGLDFDDPYLLWDDLAQAAWQKSKYFRYYHELEDAGLDRGEIREAFARRGWDL